MFATRFGAMCADTSSNLGIVNPFFARRDFAASKPWFVPEGCWTTAYTAAAVPAPLVSPNACNSIAVMGSRNAARLRSTCTMLVRLFSNMFHRSANFSGTRTSHGMRWSHMSWYKIFPTRETGEAMPNGS